jgi:TIR domain/GUN4-like
MSEFDVFLCHNSEDKAQIRSIAEYLRGQGVRPWFDEWELRPGVRWQQVLEEQILHIKSAAVFVGSNGIGPWQQAELGAFLSVFSRSHKPLIPVLLENAPQTPNLPVFLQERMWVDFRQTQPNPMKNLIWGITGNKPIDDDTQPFNLGLMSDGGNKSETQAISGLDKLESLLIAQKWREADEQTKELILKDNQDKPLTAPQIRELSLELLDRIDHLWMEASGGIFGVRIQLQAWRKVLEPEKPRFGGLFAKKVEPLTDSQAWNRFGCEIGWRGDDEKFFPDSKLSFSVKAPSGCFPRTRLWLHGGYGNSPQQFATLMKRVEELD